LVTWRRRDIMFSYGVFQGGGTFNAERLKYLSGVKVGNQDAGADGNGSGDNPLGCQDECLSGRRQCAAEGFQVCGDYDEDLCTEWSTAVACAAGEYCDEGECVSECQDACSLGQTSCGIGGVETCADHDQDGCLEWGGWSACGEEQTCQAGECVLDCSRQCTQGIQRCAPGSVEGIETCAEYDGDPCLEWGGLRPCGPDLICDPAQLRCVRPYPPGPYGTSVGDVLRNLCLEECRCGGTEAKGLPFCMRDLLDNKATLISVHTGWCPACQTQTEEAELRRLDVEVRLVDVDEDTRPLAVLSGFLWQPPAGGTQN